MKFTIYGRLDGLNEYTKANRTNAYVGAKNKRDNQNKCLSYILEQKKGRCVGKQFIFFRWYEKNNRRDLDNIAFAKKYILDALVEAKVLEDDNQEYIEGFVDEFYVDKDNPRIEVELEGLNE